MTVATDAPYTEMDDPRFEHEWPAKNHNWSINAIRERCAVGLIPAVKFIPEETVPIGWNGITIYVTKGIEIEVPQMFYDVYRDSRQGTMQAYRNAQASLEKRAFGPGQTSVESGWNGNQV